MMYIDYHIAIHRSTLSTSSFCMIGDEVSQYRIKIGEFYVDVRLRAT